MPASRAGAELPGVDARARVFEALAKAAQTFPESMPDDLDDSGLDGRDAGLAHAILDVGVRRWVTLEFLLDLFLKGPCASLEPALRGALLGGAAQILGLDRVPVHAAIDTCVEWVKRGPSARGAGMANAVLRRVAELVAHSPGGTRVRCDAWAGERDALPRPDGGALVLARPVLPELPDQRVRIAAGINRWLMRRWGEGYGHERAREFALHTLVRAPTILNTLHAASPLEEGAVELKFLPHDRPGAAMVEGGGAALARYLGSRRDVWVQDPASAGAVRSVAQLRPSVVLDACAGRGTKTRQLAMTFPNATVYACDPDEQRARSLASLPASYPNVVAGEPGVIRGSCVGRADLVLLDVPCSNTGVLARRPGARHRCSGAQLERLTGLQREILRGAGPQRSPEGVVVFSTCSLDEEENGAMARWGAKELGLRVVSETTTLPNGLPGDPPSEYHDGAYSAVLAP